MIKKILLLLLAILIIVPTVNALIACDDWENCYCECDNDPKFSKATCEADTTCETYYCRAKICFDTETGEQVIIGGDENPNDPTTEVPIDIIDPKDPLDIPIDTLPPNPQEPDELPTTPIKTSIKDDISEAVYRVALIPITIIENIFINPRYQVINFFSR